jgi:hypothetical protein
MVQNLCADFLLRLTTKTVTKRHFGIAGHSGIMDQSWLPPVLWNVPMGLRLMIWVDPAWTVCRVKVHRPVTGPQMRGTGGTLIRLGKCHRDRGHLPIIFGCRIPKSAVHLSYGCVCFRG